jgi:hypothetical protein
LRGSASICASPRLWQITCKAGTPSTAAKALSSRVQPVPALAGLPLAHSLPVMYSLDFQDHECWRGGGCYEYSVPVVTVRLTMSGVARHSS